MEPIQRGPWKEWRGALFCVIWRQAEELRRTTQKPVLEWYTPREDFSGSFAGSVTPEYVGKPLHDLENQMTKGSSLAWHSRQLSIRVHLVWLSEENPEHPTHSCPVSSEVRLEASSLCIFPSQVFARLCVKRKETYVGDISQSRC